MASDKANIEQFDRTANDSKQWAMRAEDLHTASQVLRDKVTSLKFDIENDPAGAVRDMKYAGLTFQSAMLQGFSIEAFLKAYWLVQGNKVAEDGHYNIPSIKHDSHDLPSIAVGVGFTLSTDEREVLTRLSLIVSSYGRYPITKRWQHNPLTPDQNGIPHRLSWNNQDHTTAEAIIERLTKPTAASHA
jgi:hypothetical protein